jgi:hypothetical protein
MLRENCHIHKSVFVLHVFLPANELYPLRRVIVQVTESSNVVNHASFVIRALTVTREVVHGSLCPVCKSVSLVAVEAHAEHLGTASERSWTPKTATRRYFLQVHEFLDFRLDVALLPKRGAPGAIGCQAQLKRESKPSN